MGPVPVGTWCHLKTESQRFEDFERLRANDKKNKFSSWTKIC